MLANIGKAIENTRVSNVVPDLPRNGSDESFEDEDKSLSSEDLSDDEENTDDDLSSYEDDEETFEEKGSKPVDMQPINKKLPKQSEDDLNSDEWYNEPPKEKKSFGRPRK